MPAFTGGAVYFWYRSAMYLTTTNKTTTALSPSFQSGLYAPYRLVLYIPRVGVLHRDVGRYTVAVYLCRV